MKKSIILSIIVIMTIFLTGCWDSVEINDREYIFAVGIDKTENNTLLFTAEIPKINEGSEEQRIIFSEESKNFSNFYNKSFLRSEKVISDRLMQVIILGESIASDPDTVKKIFDEIQRSPQMNRRVKIAIAKGDAKDIVNTDIPTNPIIGRFLSEMLVKLKRESYQEIYTFDEAILHLGAYGSGLLPVVESYEDSLKVESAAILKDYKLVGNLDYDENEIVMLLLNPTSSNLKNINIEVDGIQVSLGAVDVSLTENVVLKEQKLKANYYVTLYCYIDSFILGDKSLEDQNFLEKIRQAALTKISDDTTNTIGKLQNEYKADVLKLKDKLYKYHKSEYEKIADNYDNVFSEADINVQYFMNLKSTGLVK